ncbi:MAG: hypothetical protein LAT82_00660 [Nanoarchaeota archaeon]|nr:hypothetical protein [Nanoarchaeota archaeon]
MIKVESYIHPLIEDFLNKTNLLSKFKEEDSPIHLLFPQIMENHITQFKNIFKDNFECNTRIYFAKKANPSKIFTQVALDNDIHIDVASENELLDVLEIGFEGSRIECTGPKSDSFLKLAIEKNCLISCDSINELIRIISIKKEHNLENSKTSILLRISNPRISYGNITLKDSRFGILIEDLDECYSLITQNSNSIELKGFHIHRSEVQRELKAEFIKEMITQVIKTREIGFNTTIINIGGAFSPLHHVKDIHSYRDYLNILSQKLQHNEHSENWRNDFYDLSLINNQVKGLQILKQKVYQGMFNKLSYFNEILNTNFNEHITISKILEELNITLCLEPGYNLLEQSGISIAKIIDVKKYKDNSYISSCNINSSNISSTFFESLCDPIYISSSDENLNNYNNINSSLPTKVIIKPQSNASKMYLFGNTCSEDDILMRRPIYIENNNNNNEPKIGDMIIFTNTGAYKSYFQDASPLMQKKSKYFKVTNIDTNNWEILEENDN